AVGSRFAYSGIMLHADAGDAQSVRGRAHHRYHRAATPAGRTRTPHHLDVLSRSASLAYFVSSLSITRRNSSGALTTISLPPPVRLSTTLVSCRAAATACHSRSMIATGVAAGANSPIQEAAS